eukprot:scaffold23590_cov129-Isochrysis_galbana.AAC.2
MARPCASARCSAPWGAGQAFELEASAHCYRATAAAVRSLPLPLPILSPPLLLLQAAFCGGMVSELSQSCVHYTTAWARVLRV